MEVAKMLQDLNDNIFSILSPKFLTTLIIYHSFVISTIIRQTACCCLRLV